MPCDVMVLDLEDAVTPENKALSRDAAMAALALGGFAAGDVLVRANALSTEWGRADLRALALAEPGAVLLPKVNRGADVAAAREVLGDRVPVWAMIETPRSLLPLEDMAGALGLAGLVVGTNDLARDLGARLDEARAAFLPFLAMTVAAARAYGLTVLDGVYNELDDVDGFCRQCRQAADLGFDGKTLIHPKQVEPCNTAFTPTEAKLAWAATFVTAFARPDNAGRGAIGLNGRMVERLHLEQARKTLAVAKAAVRPKRVETRRI